MRLDYISPKAVENASTKLLLKQALSDKERLTIIRYLAKAAKLAGDLRQWHNFLSLIENYEKLPDLQKIDEILTRWISKLEIPNFFEEE